MRWEDVTNSTVTCITLRKINSACMIKAVFVLMFVWLAWAAQAFFQGVSSVQLAAEQKSTAHLSSLSSCETKLDYPEVPWYIGGINETEASEAASGGVLDWCCSAVPADKLSCVWWLRQFITMKVKKGRGMTVLTVLWHTFSSSFSTFGWILKLVLWNFTRFPYCPTF